MPAGSRVSGLGVERSSFGGRLVSVAMEAAPRMGNELLVISAREGDARAVERLLEQLSRELLPLAAALTKGSADTDALVGDTLSRVYERLDQLQEPSAISAWARRILVRSFLDHRRWRLRRREVGFESAMVAPRALPSAAVLDLHGALAALGREDRALIVLRYWNGMTQEECADVLRVPIGTVKSRLSRLLTKLRIALGSDTNE